MKDSGVEWLGELPQAWSVGKLSYYTSIKLGKMVQKDESVGGKFIPYLSAISIQNEYLDDATDKKMWASPIDFTSLSLLRNDLLVVEGGTAGMTAHLAADFPNIIFQNSLNRVRVHQEMMVSRFVFYWLNSLRYRGLIESICNKATIMHLTREKLASLPIVCPPRQKQIGIVEYLDQETSQIDTLVEKTRRAIELLKERRQALITQVVTGKIDVRGFAGGNS
jgi:type I restriction enzyme S subunit